MIAPSTTTNAAGSVAPDGEDWSEIEALLEAPGKELPPSEIAAKPRRPRFALGMIALIALGGGSAVLKAAIMPGCRGDACDTRIEASVPAHPALRDVTVTPVQIAAEPHDTTQPMLQGRSIGTSSLGRRLRRAPSRAVTISHPRFVAAKPPSRPHNVARAPVPVPVRHLASVRPVMAKQAMRSTHWRSVRLQRVTLSPTRYIIVERR